MNPANSILNRKPRRINISKIPTSPLFRKYCHNELNKENIINYNEKDKSNYYETFPPHDYHAICNKECGYNLYYLRNIQSLIDKQVKEHLSELESRWKKECNMIFIKIEEMKKEIDKWKIQTMKKLDNRIIKTSESNSFKILSHDEYPYTYISLNSPVNLRDNDKRKLKRKTLERKYSKGKKRCNARDIVKSVSRAYQSSLIHKKGTLLSYLHPRDTIYNKEQNYEHINQTFDLVPHIKGCFYPQSELNYSNSQSVLIEQYSTPPSSLLSRSNSISHSRYFNRGIDKIEIVDKSSLRVEKTINFRYLCQGYECFTIRKKGEGIKTSRKNITRRKKRTSNTLQYVGILSIPDIDVKASPISALQDRKKKSDDTNTEESESLSPSLVEMKAQKHEYITQEDDSNLCRSFEHDKNKLKTYHPILVKNGAKKKNIANKYKLNMFNIAYIKKESSTSFPSYKYTEVVRTQSKRTCLPAHTCAKCDECLNAICDAKGGHVFNKDKMINKCSRHRTMYKQTNTPEGFWELSFIDERNSTL